MKPIALRWLAGHTHKGAASWGMPWPKGVIKPGGCYHFVGIGGKISAIRAITGSR